MISIHKDLVALVESIVPVNLKKHKFKYVGEGAQQPLETLHGTRVFDLQMVTPPVDDKLAGQPRTRFRIALSLRVLYESDGDSTFTQMMIAGDIPLIENKLIFPPFPSGVDTILPPEGTTFTKTETGSYMLQVPLVVIYRS